MTEGEKTRALHANTQCILCASQVRVGGQWSAVFNASTVAYSPPRITGISVISVVSTALGLMDTRGGDLLVINGTSLGPAGTPVTALIAAYSSALGSATALTFMASACYVPASASSVAVICLTAPGAGTGLQVSLSVGGQATTSPAGLSIAYQPPVMTALSGRGVNNAETVGGQAVIITGDQVRYLLAAGVGWLFEYPTVCLCPSRPTVNPCSLARSLFSAEHSAPCPMSPRCMVSPTT